MNNTDKARHKSIDEDPLSAKRQVISKSLEDVSSATLSKMEMTRTKSVDDRRLSQGLVVMEEVSPLKTTLLDNDEIKWRMPLTSLLQRNKETQLMGKKLPKCIRRYYKKQNELIEAFEGIQLENDNSAEANDANKALMRKSSILAKLSFVINLLLLIGKAVAAGLSGSLAVITSVIDSAVDLVSGILMWWSSRAMKNRDRYEYPQGRTKLEPVAIVVLSVVMALASVQMIIQAIEKIIAFAINDLQPPYLHNESDVMCINISDMKQYVQVEGESGPVFEVESIVICVSTICIKLILFIICRRVATPSAQALAQDHRNDVISNTGAVVCGLIGYRLWKYADPLGAIIISIYIIISWFLMGWTPADSVPLTLTSSKPMRPKRERTNYVTISLCQIKMLTGHTARPDFLKKLTFIAVNHHPKVTYIDTVRAFHFGSNFLVEVDIVLQRK